MLTLVLCGTALGQQVQVSGTVTSTDGELLRGVTIQVRGTDVTTSTDENGRYTISSPRDGVVIFTFIGYRAMALNVAGRTTLDVVMEPTIAVLGEVIVTGYTEQRRADITGAISSVDIEKVSSQTSVSVLQSLAGSVPGVQVEASGTPGARNTVRIRGVSSFQNNEPLYIIDGTPIESDYLNFLNTNDIESIQVLKDASAASIYGSRASNGVVLIQTKRGREGAPQFTMDVKMGMATPVKGYNSFLMTDALQYAEFVKRLYENAGQPVPQNVYGDPNNPTVPAYIWPNDGVHQTQAGDVDPSTYVWGDPNNQNLQIMPGSAGTDWWDVVFSPALVQDYNLSVSGGSVDHRYSVSTNYLNQEGTAAYNRVQRGGVRVNTEFNVGKLTIGENMSLSREESYGGGDQQGEGGFMGKNILSQPVVPVYDIGGNFASGKATGLGNNTNPLKAAYDNKDDVFRQNTLFGNVFGTVQLSEGLRVRTSLGFNLADWAQTSFNGITPENSEPSFSDGINEQFSVFRDWTWSNTLTYSTTLGDRHSFDILIGQEANQTRSRYLSAGINNLLTTDINARYIQDAIGDPDSKNVNSSGSKSSLASFFGKIDYSFADRYMVNFTLRRDGSSRFGPDHRWGTFPAFSLGWRLSQEPFMQGNQFFSNIMLRFGWGITGNQSIPSGRIVSQYGGGTGDTYYDIGGTGSSIQPGFRQVSLGNPDLKWEEQRSMNAGLDLEFANGNANIVVDVYQRDTDNLLFAPPVPATAGAATPPIINIGEMRNRGIDFSIGYSGTIGSGNWRVTFNGSHYKNEIRRIDGVQDFFFGDAVGARYGFRTINQIGDPIGAFYGLLWDGFFEDQAAVDAHATQDGAAPGRIRFVDLNNDGVINSDDRTIMGSPHPDFTGGLDLSLSMGRFDFTATFFGSFGNEIMEVNKQFYVFRNFSTNVRADILTESWEPGKTDAKYPRIDINDVYSGQNVSSYYVEDGSYVRLRNLLIGYQVPQSFAFLRNARVYVQAENLFTLTGYPGLDPALPALQVGGAAGNVRDQYRGWDRGAYPSNRTFSLGINVSF